MGWIWGEREKRSIREFQVLGSSEDWVVGPLLGWGDCGGWEKYMFMG